ncbi:MAG: tRNA dihydrouridine synthase DusB [Hydrogenoanaerobacterium sp.]
MNEFINIGGVQISRTAALAPMAGVADKAFREICREFGACYAVGEMVSSKGLTYNSRKSAELLVTKGEAHPTAIQLFGDSPSTMAQAAELALSYCPDIIDINMGCPAPKIAKNGGGSALMRNPALAGEIIAAVVKAVPVPVTVKLRKGWDDENVNVTELAKIAEQNGAAAITVHGRTREQMYAPPVDAEIIAQVKKAVCIPVIANGDIKDIKSCTEMYEKTGADLVMIGRGALGNPWVFAQIAAYFKDGTILPPPDIEEKMRIMLKQVRLACGYKTEGTAMREARKHAAWYLSGIHGAAAYRKAAGTLCTYSDLERLVEDVLRQSGGKNKAE